MENIKIVTQARVGSSRLPSKVLKEIAGKSLLAIHLKRLKKASCAKEIIVATTLEEDAYKIIKIAEDEEVPYYQGSTNDVLDRFYQALKNTNTDYVVRVTSDCPLIDPQLIDHVVNFAIDEGVDYVSNGLNDLYPDGQDIEVFKFSALEIAWKEAKLLSEREHVTPFIRNNSDLMGGQKFTALGFPSKSDFSQIRMTVDEELDFILMEKLINELGMEQDWITYANYIIEQDLSSINGNIIRNEGYLKSLKRDQNE